MQQEIMTVIDQIIDIKEKNYYNAREIVPVEDWLRDDYYVGPVAKDLYDYWRDVIVEFEHGDYNDLILTGGFGCGKSYTALVLMMREIFKLSCYSHIPNALGLAESSTILFIYLAATIRQADLTGFGKLRKMIDSCPYFRDIFKRNKDKDSILEFKGRELVVISGSEMGHFKGGDLYCGVLDEGNFQKGSARLRLQKAIDIYVEMTNRRKTRFVRDGVDYGFSVIVSSVDTMSSFTEERIKAAASDPKTMIIRGTAFKTHPEKFSKERFWVFQGDDMTDPFIEYDEQALGRYLKRHNLDSMVVNSFPPHLLENWTQVPVEFRSVFETDVIRGLADISGIAKGATNRLFVSQEKFELAFPRDTGYEHPFTKKEVSIGYLSSDRLEYYIREDWEGFDSNYLYHAHIDQSLTGDSAGLAISHRESQEEGGVCVIDMMMRIVPPPKPDKISITKIREFFFWLIQHKNLNLDYISYDQFQSAESLQAFDKAGIECGLLSVDKDTAQYDLLVELILSKMLVGYFYEPFSTEFFGLEKDMVKRKVDHTSGGSKDVSDACAGAVFHSWHKTPMESAMVRLI